MSFLPSCPATHSFLSFARAPAWPLAYTRAFTINPGFRSPGLHRLGSSVVPVHLVPLHRSHTPWSCLIFFSRRRLFVFLRARAHICQNLSFKSASQHGRRLCEHPEPFGFSMQEAQAHRGYLCRANEAVPRWGKRRRITSVCLLKFAPFGNDALL